MSDNDLLYDVKVDAKLNKYYTRGDKISVAEKVLLSLTIIFIIIYIAVFVYGYTTSSLMFNTYIRSEGPPGTVSAESTVNMVS